MIVKRGCPSAARATTSAAVAALVQTDMVLAIKGWRYHTLIVRLCMRQAEVASSRIGDPTPSSQRSFMANQQQPTNINRLSGGVG